MEEKNNEERNKPKTNGREKDSKKANLLNQNHRNLILLLKLKATHLLKIIPPLWNLNLHYHVGRNSSLSSTEPRPLHVFSQK